MALSTSESELIRQLTFAFHPLEEMEFQAWAACFQPYKAGRKVLLSPQGQTETYVYIVLEGVQRLFYQNEDGKEATLVFTYAPSFGGVIDSAMLKQPSRWAYETLTSSRFLRAHINELMAIRHLPGIAELLRKGLAQTLSGVLERMAEMQCMGSEERFRRLLKRSPHILNLVPHKYLANYIGIEASNFSKFLHSVKI